MLAAAALPGQAWRYNHCLGARGGLHFTDRVPWRFTAGVYKGALGWFKGSVRSAL